ncbi:hypothetical protein CLU79DRAFT_768941 [Phycomyces nitens]|nr:hypothetical protein CLU79DRAFT_768941 [Phycomyces nitens]
MNLEKTGQLSLGYPESSHSTPPYIQFAKGSPKRDIKAYPYTTLSVGEYGQGQPSRVHGGQRPTGSQSTPLGTTRKKNGIVDPQDRLDFLRDMQKTRNDMKQFRNDMSVLAKEIDSMSIEINQSKNRILEIEQDLTATQEMNVNLQVLLENALESQKEEDVHATQTIKAMYSDLATVAYENNQLHGRLSLIEKGQKKHKGSIYDVEERIKEYTSMLGQAQDTIHMLQEPHSRRLDEELLQMPLDAFDSRRTSETLSWPGEPELSLQKESQSTFHPHNIP